MKPALLFYCQHSVGMGHLARSFALTRALRDRFNVTLLCGGALPEGIPLPQGVRLLALPPRGEDGNTAMRRESLLSAYAAMRPSVLLIELFPFGRKKFANELLPLLKAARRDRTRPLIVCSLRDILVSARKDQAHHDDRAAWLCNRYFDRVLVHADAKRVRLEDSFAPARQRLRIPVDYTGYVAPTVAQAGPRGDWILVSAGGGLVGMPLFTRVLQAHRLLDPATRPPLRIVAGPFLPETEYSELQAMAQASRAVRVLRVVPDLAAEMSCACASISQCGYNTAMDIAATATPALVAPYATPTETEQLQRAREFKKLGVFDWIDLRTASDLDLAMSMQRLRYSKPRPMQLDLDGSRKSCELLARLVEQRRLQERDHAA